MNAGATGRRILKPLRSSGFSIGLVRVVISRKPWSRACLISSAMVRPTPIGLRDVFVARLDPQLDSLLQATYLGGSYNELDARITVSPSLHVSVDLDRGSGFTNVIPPFNVLSVAQHLDLHCRQGRPRCWL